MSQGRWGECKMQAMLWGDARPRCRVSSRPIRCLGVARQQLPTTWSWRTSPAAGKEGGFRQVVWIQVLPSPHSRPCSPLADGILSFRPLSHARSQWRLRPVHLLSRILLVGSKAQVHYFVENGLESLKAVLSVLIPILSLLQMAV